MFGCELMLDAAFCIVMYNMLCLHENKIKVSININFRRLLLFEHIHLVPQEFLEMSDLNYKYAIDQ